MDGSIAGGRPDLHPRRRERQRRLDLDRAKGLAIVLVVFGHLVAREDPRGVDWYEPLRHAVYMFHMPFFFYLSGYVSELTGATATPPAGWPGLARRRAERLLLPFLLFGAAILLGKTALAPLLPIDHAPARLLDGLGALVWHTQDSPASSVWYLVVLFACSLAAPVLLACDGGRTRLLLGVAALLFVLPAPPLMYLDRLCGNLVFFAAGILAARAGGGWLRTIDHWGLPALAVLLVLAFSVKNDPAAPFWRLVVGLLGLPALHAAVRAAPCAGLSVLLELGRCCFVIYLFNTICIGLAKGLLLTVMPWDGADFLIFAPLLMTAGIAGPIAIKQVLARFAPRLDRLTD